ncbi:hypothetical protein FRB91_001906 [Serendipita sp. 411]|nr:hypothetical protein FRB91_001906 [Serendipita sp. 411]
MVNNLVSCISCGVTEATTQYEIDLAEQGINQYLQMCSQLGYNDISITVTARPTVSFPCTDNSATPTAATTENTGKPLGTTSAVASSSGGLTPTPTPSPSNPLGGIDPSDLSVINSLLGQLSSFTF